VETPPDHRRGFVAIVELESRLKALEREVGTAKGAALDAWRMAEEARDAARRTAEEVTAAVARLERCFRGDDEGPGAVSHRQLQDGIGKLSRGLDRVRKELRNKGHRGPNVEDSSIWAIPPVGFVAEVARAAAQHEREDPNAIVRGRGSWRVRLPSGKWRIIALVLSHVVAGTALWKLLLEPLSKLLH
jgi:hypothetical protein